MRFGALLAFSLLSTACGVDVVTANGTADPSASATPGSGAESVSDSAPVVAAALAFDGDAADSVDTVVAGSEAARLVGSDSPSYLEQSDLAEVTVPPSTIVPLESAVVASQSVSSTSTDSGPPAPVPSPAMSTPPPTTAPPPTTSPPLTTAAPGQLPNDAAASAQFVADINGLRAGVGVAGLTRSAELDSRALEWARVIAAEGVLRHSSIISSLTSGSWSAAGENLGYGPTEAIIFSELAKSSTHYATMASSIYTHVGVAVVAVGPYLWTVHIFAA